jgi:hypothetical protein
MNEVGRAFEFAEPVVAWDPVAGGHIHDTFLASGATRRYIVQRLNERVFTDIATLMNNYELVLAHLAAARTRAQVLVRTTDGATWWRAGDGHAWRAFEFLESTAGREQVTSTADATEAARVFGAFTGAVSDLDPESIQPAIPHFHDLARRRAALEAAIDRDAAGRGDAVRAEADRARELGAQVEALIVPLLPTLPERIAHNDAKIANVRFDVTTGRAACVVDLDTVTPGTVLNDVGELVRTATSHAAEDAPDVATVDFDLDRLRAVADGFLGGAAGTMTPGEVDALAVAGPWLAVENGVRFLADYLDGDQYFRVTRPGHNLERARVQLRLTELMLDQLDAARTIFAETAGTR